MSAGVLRLFNLSVYLVESLFLSLLSRFCYVCKALSYLSGSSMAMFTYEVRIFTDNRIAYNSGGRIAF